jgi:hypothetical protein
VPSLSDRLRSRSWNTFADALVEAFKGGEEGDVALAEVIVGLPKDRQSLAAAVMGDMRGQAGDNALRRLLHSPDAASEPRGTALGSLAKRCGFAVIDDIVNSLDSKDWRWQDAAVQLLAIFGDDRAWDKVFERLERRLRTPPRKPVDIDNSRDEIREALRYLLRHVDAPDGLRKAKVATLLRKRWDHIGKSGQEWLEKHWHESCPGGPAPEAVGTPDIDAITEEAIRGYREPTDWEPIIRA